MSQISAKGERLEFFSDAVFGVIITVMVLDLRPPAGDDWAGLARLWPTAVSYAMSYLFVAIVWVNHHHILRFAEVTTPALIWGNFGHLFTVSLVPFSTAWVADTRMAAMPVCVYAAVFALVNLSYIALCFEVVDRRGSPHLSPKIRGMMRMRSVTTLAVFLVAGGVAIWHPLVGFGLICCCLLVHTRPDGATQG
jgi:uncharacterized membrane protein